MERRADRGDPDLPSEEEFFQRLQRFPNLFFQRCVQKASRGKLKSSLDTIMNRHERREQELAPDLEEEDDPQNLAVFLQWKLGDELKAEAERKAAQMVEEQPDSLLALSNQAYILWHKGQTQLAVELLCTLETLKREDPTKYENLEMEAQSEIVYLYIRLGHLFKPYAVSDLQEKLLQRRPHDGSIKLTLAQTLRRYTNPSYTRKHPQVDFCPAMCRAIQLLVEIKDDENNSPDLRARALAELGETLNWHPQEKLRAIVDQEQARLRLSPAHCFEEAAQLAEDNPTALVWAGKYFRYGNLDRSKQLLEKAAEIRSEPKTHHQLGLTLKKLALQEKQGSYRPQGNQGRGARGGQSYSGFRRGNQRYQNPGRDSAIHYQREETLANGMITVLSWEDRYVQETIDQFQLSLDLSGGDNFVALFDLGLMFFSLREYEQALDHFLKAAECTSGSMFEAIKVWQHNGLVLAEMAKNDDQHQDMSQLCLHLFLITQCRLVLQSQEVAAVNRETWFSFYSLSTMLQQNRRALTTNAELEESTLLWNLKVLSSSLPVLSEITNYSRAQAVDSETLETDLQCYLDSRRYHEALLFLHLLKLTSQSHLTSAWKEANLLRNTCVQLAGSRLLSCIGKSDVENKINTMAAQISFRIAFEESFSGAAVTESSAELPTSPSQRHTSPEDLLVPQNPSWYLSNATSSDEATEDELSEPELDDSMKEGMHVLLVYDLQGQEASEDVHTLHTMTSEQYGLQTLLMAAHTQPDGRQTARTDEMAQAQLIIFIVETSDVSPDFLDLIQQATETTALTQGDTGSQADQSVESFSSSHVLALVMNSARLPSALQDHRSFSMTSAKLRESQGGSRSVAGLRACCELFCGLVGIDTE